MAAGDTRFKEEMFETRAGKPRDDEGGVRAFRTDFN